MKAIVAGIVGLVVLQLGQTEEDRKLLALVKARAQECAQALVKEDFEKFADLVYPKVITDAGGRKVLISFMKETAESWRRRDTRLLAFDMETPDQIVRAQGDLIALVPGTMHLVGPSGKATQRSFLIGISGDDGKTWKFIDAAKAENVKALRQLVPHWPVALQLPGRGAPAAQVKKVDEKKEEFAEAVLPAANVKLLHPPYWKTLRPSNEFSQLILENQGAFVLLTVMETHDAVETLAEEYARELKLRGEVVKEVVREYRATAGAKALFVRLDTKDRGIKKNLYVTTFSHQGYVYRFLGAPAPGVPSARFEQDYFSILDSVRFLRDRTEWLAKYEGKPVSTAFLAGLVSLELNRPRWIENTFDSPQDHQFLEQVVHRFFAGGAWIYLWARETSGDVQDELDHLKLFLATRYSKINFTNTKIKGPRGYLPGLRLVGEFQNQEYHVQATVLVEDGIVVQVMMECLASQVEATRRDWDQLMRSLTLDRQSKPVQPLAYPLRRPVSGRQQSRPALDVFLSKAKPLYVAPQHNDVACISPDGSFAYLLAPEGDFLENLVTRKKELVAPRSQIVRPVALDRQGKRLAYVSQGQIAVQTMEGRVLFRVPGQASSLCFGPGEDDLLVATSSGQEPRPFNLQQRYVTSRLERINIRDASRVTLVDFPLCRVAHPAVSPDGKSIALVCNRDYPRAAQIGGHLYVCRADGSELRQLTRDPEEISSVAWSADGQSLYVVRRLCVGEGGVVGLGGFSDLYRIKVATGESLNMTRSGRLGKVWCGGSDVLLETVAYDMPPSQHGVFRIGAEELVRLTAHRPSPPPADPRAQSKAVATRLEKALGIPVKEVVPTPQVVDRLAHAFAAAIKAEYGLDLDFGPTSLNLLGNLADMLDMGSGREPAVLLGFGAYYGETLRKVAGAEWKLQPLPFGAWAPARTPQTSALVQAILPWSSSYRWAIHSGEDFLRRAEDVQGAKPKFILVYPPAHVDQAVRAATPKYYTEALALVNRGEVAKALEILAAELDRNPRHALLAQEILGLCEGANLRDTARALTRRAVEAGNEVPELLVRYADDITRDDPKKALDLYRKAAHGPFVPAEYLMKLGQQHVRLGQPALAEACWRRAYHSASDLQRRDILNFLGMDPPRNVGMSLGKKGFEP